MLALLFVTLPFVVRDGAAGAARARPRDGGGGRLARRRAVRDLPAHRAAEHPPRDPLRRRARVRAGDRRVRLARPDLGQPPFKTEVASVYIFGRIQSGDTTGATAVSVVLLVDLARSSCSGSAPSAAGGRAMIGRYAAALRRARLPDAAARAAGRDGLLPRVRARLRAGLARGHDAGGEARVPADARGHRDRRSSRTRSSASCSRSRSCGTASAGAASSTRSSTCRSRSRRSSSGSRSTCSTAAAAGSAPGSRTAHVLFSTPGIVLATVFVSLPFVVREVVPVLREIGTEQEQAAATLGAGSFQTFRRVTFPAIRWAVAYGVVLTTARAIGEFGAVSVVSGSVDGQDADAHALRPGPVREQHLRPHGRLRRVGAARADRAVHGGRDDRLQAEGGHVAMGITVVEVSKRFGELPGARRRLGRRSRPGR